MATADEQAESDVKNGVLMCLKDILIPISRLQTEGVVSVSQAPCAVDAPPGTVFSVDGEHFQSYDEVVQLFHSSSEWRARVAEAVVEAVNGLLEPIRELYKGSGEWQRADKYGYPIPDRVFE